MVEHRLHPWASRGHRLLGYIAGVRRALARGEARELYLVDHRRANETRGALRSPCERVFAWN
jgi:hypothetical protein